VDGRRVDVFAQQRHGFALLWARRLVDDDLQSGKLAIDLLPVDQMQARREDGRFEDRVPGSVESNELPPRTVMYDSCLDPRARRRRVDRSDLHLTPGTRRIQNDAAHDRSRKGRVLWTSDGRLRKQENIVREIHDGDAGRAEITERRGLEKRFDDDPLFPPLHTHRCEVDHAAGR